MYDCIKINHNNAYLSDLTNISMVFLQLQKVCRQIVVRVHRSWRIIFVEVSVAHAVTLDCVLLFCTGVVAVPLTSG